MLCIPRLSEIVSCRLPHLNWITKNLKMRIRCSKALCLLTTLSFLLSHQSCIKLMTVQLNGHTSSPSPSKVGLAAFLHSLHSLKQLARHTKASKNAWHATVDKGHPLKFMLLWRCHTLRRSRIDLTRMINSDIWKRLAEHCAQLVVASSFDSQFQQKPLLWKSSENSILQLWRWEVSTLTLSLDGQL